MLVIGGVVVLILVGAAAYFSMTQFQKAKQVTEALDKARQNWERLERQSPHPGTEDVDNIAAARQDVQVADDFLQQVDTSYSSLNYPLVTNNFQFKTLLERSIAQLRNDAEESGVAIPDGYDFTFRGQMDKLQFESENLQVMVNQLEEVKAICRLLFDQRVLSLEGLRRVPTGRDDRVANDFLPLNMVTNQVAIRVPYEVTFKGFSGELANVLQAFANAKQCYRIRSIQINPTELPEEGTQTTSTTTSSQAAIAALQSRYGTPGAGGGGSDYASRYGLTPGGRSSGGRYGGRSGAGDRYADRYGRSGGRSGGSAEATRERRMESTYGQRRELPTPGTSRYNAPTTPGYTTTPTPRRQTSEVIKEKPLEITLLVEFIKPVVAAE